MKLLRKCHRNGLIGITIVVAAPKLGNAEQIRICEVW